MTPPPTALIVSSNSTDSTLITDELSSHGYAVTCVDSYDSAITALLDMTGTAVLIVDMHARKHPRGTALHEFTHWLKRHMRQKKEEELPHVIYIRNRTTRSPSGIYMPSTMLRRPCVPEALGEILGYRATPNDHGYKLDMNTFTFKGPLGTAQLTRIEALLLAYLRAHEGETITPAELMQKVWKYHYPEGAATLMRAHIHNVRDKLRPLGADHLIETVRGKGYRYVNN